MQLPTSGENQGLNRSEAAVSFRLDPLSRIALTWGLVLVSAMAWVHRYTMNPDALSYLEVGEAWLRGDSGGAVNRYWNPLYSILCALSAHLSGPGKMESVGPHLLGVLLYVAAMFAFRRFMEAFLDDVRDQSCDPLFARSIFLPVASGLFVWATVYLIDPAYCVPDLLILVWILLAAGSWLRAQWWSFGFFLAAGYLTKPVLFPLGVLFLVALMLPRHSANWDKRAALSRVIRAGAVFLAVSAVYILPLSKQKGRFTFSDSGGLAYAWEVNGISPYFHWQGRETGSGRPLHPTREILTYPPTYEFDGPRPGTYSPWFDPAYWNDGLRSHFDFQDQLKRLKISALFYLNLLVRGPLVLLLGLVLYAVLSKARRSFLAGIGRYMGLLLPCAAAFVLYALVFVISRYLAPFIFLCGVFSLFACFRSVRAEAKWQKRFSLAFIFLCLGFVALFATKSMARELRQPNARSYRVHERVAEALQQAGVHRGDKIGVIGVGCDAYYARLAGMRIVAETLIFPGHPAWEPTPENLRRIAEAMATRTEAKAIVSAGLPIAADPHWRLVPGTSFRVFRLPVPER